MEKSGVDSTAVEPQSNQRGIETKSCLLQFGQEIPPQSNQRGIETDMIIAR